MKKIKNLTKRLLIYVLAIVSFTTAILGIALLTEDNTAAYATDNNATDDNTEADFVYLSDYDYVKQLNGKKVSYATKDTGYNVGAEIVLNGPALTNVGGQISLSEKGEIEEGYAVVKNYSKGITACAPSEVVYDISAFNYDYFSTYYGVEGAVAPEIYYNPKNSLCKFYFYTSEDGETWTLESEENPPELNGFAKQSKIQFSIAGKKYIKLKAVPAYENTEYNHAVYANPILYKEGYSTEIVPYDFIKTVEEYDEILKTASYDEILTTKESALLCRKFVSYYQYDTLQEFAHIDEAHKKTIEWILSDTEALRYLVVGDTPGRPGNESLVKITALNVLHKMYSAYASDMENTTETEYTTLGNLYKRMIISITLAYGSPVKFNYYGGNYEESDPVRRYAIYKKLHIEGKLKNEMFENLTVPQMRIVLGSTLDDEEIEWLNWYVREVKGGSLNCHSYMPYRGGNYQAAAYYSAANYATWDEKYHLKEFNITYGNRNYPKLWMVYEQGAYCGGISQNGIYVCQVLGIPAQFVTQPGHGAYLFLTRNSAGQYAWATAYDIFGVVNSSGTAKDPLMMKWGFRTWQSQSPVTTDNYKTSVSGGATYIMHAQHALNDYDNFIKAEETRLFAEVFTKYPTLKASEDYIADGTIAENNTNAQKIKEVYEKVLEYQPINLYGWHGLINAYKDDLNSTPEDFVNLAKRISENLYLHPYSMYDLFNEIEPKVKGTMYYASFKGYLNAGFKKGYIAGTAQSPTDYLQSNVTRAHAGKFLGLPETKYEIATFSFDGANAGKIILGQNYYGSGMSWEYNLGSGWKRTIEKEVVLTDEEIASINTEYGIRIHMVGVDYDEENIFTINIGKAVLPADAYNVPKCLYGNDLENRVVNADISYEWRYSENDAWTSYATALPDLSGNKSVTVRISAHGTNLASDGRTFTFTEDVSDPSRNYIPVSRISLYDVSLQATGGHAGNAVYALDANYNTRWHSNWNGADTQRFISVKFDKPIFISAVEFVPAGGGNGKILDGTIYGSLDGVTWRKLAERKNLRYANQCNTIAEANANIQSFDIENPQDVLYIKIVADRASNGNWFTARAFNFFEDTTQEHRPAATIEYSTTDPTNGNVTAILKNLFPDEHITITNNDGIDTYTFTENDTFTFTYINDDGVEGRTTATVTWIDREAPTAIFDYSTTQTTGGKVVVILKPSEEVTVTNRSDIIYAVDENGNVIDLTVEQGENNENVLNGYTVDEEGFVKNPAGEIMTNINPFRMEFSENGEFTFEFTDLAGNTASAKVVVTWIDKSPLIVTLAYDKTEATNGNVTATIVFDKLAEVTNNDGSLTYVFTENGEFTFEYVDAAGNTGSITAKVTWIDKAAPVATVNYDKTVSTNQNVTATVSFDKQGVTVTNNDGKLSYTFTQNGEFTFEYVDAAGNTGSIKAKVDWIVNDVPIIPDENDVVIEYDKTQKDKAIVTITVPGQNVIFVDGSDTFAFTKNGTYEVKYYDEKGTLYSVKVVVDWLEESEKSNLPIIIGVSVGVVVLTVAIVSVVVIIKKRKV